jgi:hypothetical protein
MKEEGRRKKEEGRRKKEEGHRVQSNFDGCGMVLLVTFLPSFVLHNNKICLVPRLNLRRKIEMLPMSPSSKHLFPKTVRSLN